MIQDIAPSKLDNSYHAYVPGADDFLMIFDPDGKLLVSSEKDHLGFPTAWPFLLPAAEHIHPYKGNQIQPIYTT